MRDIDDWEQPPARSRGGRQRTPDFEEVDLGRALVPTQNGLDPMIQGGAGLPMVPGMPASDEEERALGIRRPAYIPATGERRGPKPSSWRVVSGVLSIVLVTLAGCGLAGFLGRGQIEHLLAGPIKTHLTPPAINYGIVPATPVATPGPAATYVQSAITAQAVDSNYNAQNANSHFLVNTTVYVVLAIRGVPKDQKHVVSVRWFLGGQDIGVQWLSGAPTTWPITQDSNAYFGLVYPAAGVGMAKIYWDKPASDTGDDPHDPHLAQTIYFAVMEPTPTPVPTQAKPSGTTKPGTVTPGTSDVGAAPVAWRGRFQST